MRLVWYRNAWACAWTEAGRTRRASLRTQDRGLAERRLADLERQPVGPLVGDIFAAYLREKDQTAARPAGLHDCWKALKSTFAHLRPDQVDRPLCRAYAARRRRAGRQPATANKELRILRAALRWHDPQTPAVFEMPSPPPPTSRHLTRADYARLLAAAETAPHLRLFIVLALATAARSQAVLELTWDRVDFRRGRIHLAANGPDRRPQAGPEDGQREARGRKGRATVPMTAPARTALEAARRGARTRYVIEYADRPVGSVKKAFARAAARADLTGVTPKVLRHTAAVWMAEDRVPMSEIAQYLGHRDDRITQRVYARYSPDYLGRAARALEP